ncbi:MAG: hypothetical protein KF861_18940, partial [Planctomycetaceae bacterium]|nr:hypothetical protein [Planctomycetaceae bacterium]
LFLVALGGLIGLQFLKPPTDGGRRALLTTTLFVASLLLLPTDQQRLQPWVWQMVVAAVVIGAATSDRVALVCLRWFTVSIYFWSAVSKLDWAFIEGRGQWLLEGLAAGLGLPYEMWRDETRLFLAALLPLGELTVALCLLPHRTRRIGLALAIAMHSLLILALGPWGHGQLPAVLLWNVYFVVQNVLLFGRNRETVAANGDVRPMNVLPSGDRGEALNVQSASTSGASGLRDQRAAGSPVRAEFTVLFTLLVCLLPSVSLWGYWDHWPSWAVYSERPDIVRLSIVENDIERIPVTLQPFVGPAEPLSDWRAVNLDAWSFATRRCPMYPQLRFRLAVIDWLTRTCGVPAQVRAFGPPNRWTGKRKELAPVP